MALLRSWKRKIGFFKEVTYGTPGVATDFPPFTTHPKFEEVPVMIRDQAGRGSRSADQGIYQGVIGTTGTYETFAYPGVLPHLMLGVLGGTDTVTGPSAKTGTLGVLASTGLTTATYTLVGGAAPLTGETYMIDSGLITEEAVLLSNVTGAGPYSLTFATTPTKYTHLAGAAAASMWTHVMTMGVTQNSYCYSDWYDGPNELQFPGMLYEKVSLKYVANADFKVTPTLRGGWPVVTTSEPSEVYTLNSPLMAWQGILTLNSVLTPKLITMDLDLTQVVAHQYGANGLQNANAGIAGAFTAEGKLTFAITDDTERNFFHSNQQVACLLTFTSGAKTVTLQMSKIALMPPTAVDTGTAPYAILSANFTAINNTTDLAAGSPIKFTEVDTRSTPY